ncbi:MAG: type II toxin-antitoxin system Phd/YefM family antitoxin, partial [Mycobacterium sp.]
MATRWPSEALLDLRNHGGEVLDTVARGESVTVTRDGVAVAELRPLPRRVPSAAQLIERRRHLPRIDPERFRRDIDTGANCSFASADSWAEASPRMVEFHSRASRRIRSAARSW